MPRQVTTSVIGVEDPKPKAKGTSRASKPRRSATKSKSPPKAGTKAKPGTRKAKPVKLLSGGNPVLGLSGFRRQS
jgi:hypothetical protein